MKIYFPGIRCYNEIKLNTNENFFNCSKNVYFLIKIYNNYIEKIKFYPDSNCFFLKYIISKQIKLKPNNVFICNGSDEGLFFVFTLLKKYFLKTLKITYPFYKIYCKYNNIKFKTVKINKIFLLNNFVLTNPNSPTGAFFNCFKILKKNNKNKIIIIDEAYSDFSNYSFINNISINNNIIISKTFSKSFSIANIRIGFLVSNKFIIKKIENLKQCFNSYTVSSLNSYIAIECLKDKHYFYYSVQNNIYLKFLINNTLCCNFNFYGNFIFIKSNLNLFFFLLKKKVFIRKFVFSKKKYFRITIPNFIVLKKIIKIIKIWS